MGPQGGPQRLLHEKVDCPAEPPQRRARAWVRSLAEAQAYLSSPAQGGFPRPARFRMVDKGVT